MRPPLRFGARTQRLATTPSTMDEARRLAEDGAPEGTVVRADVQTGGRGRAGRSWASPTGGLYLSVVLRPSRPVAEWTRIPIAAGVGLHDALVGYARSARLKWPNDVLVPAKTGARKLAGVLVEGVPGRYAILGVGVNVAPPAEGLPDVASSLADFGASVALDRLASETLACLEMRYGELEAGAWPAVRDAWSARSVTLGARVRVGAGGTSGLSDRRGEDAEGVAVRLADDGGLVVRRDDGSEVVVASGDVHAA